MVRGNFQLYWYFSCCHQGRWCPLCSWQGTERRAGKAEVEKRERKRERDFQWMVLANEIFFPGAEFMWTGCFQSLMMDPRSHWWKNKRVFRNKEGSANGGQAKLGSLRRGSKWRQRKASTFRVRLIPFPLLSLPPPASKQLKRILCFIWQEISKWPVVKLWASWYGLFAWPFCFRNFVYAWVIWKLAAGQPPPVPPFCGNRRSFWTLLTISEHREAPSGSLFWIPHMPLSHGEEPQFPLSF